MKLAGDKANNYFSNPDANHTAILIYGADSMRVALRRQELLKSLIGENAEEEMRLTRISGSDLRNDPALLLDGLKANGFFPGPRAVFVEGATDTNSIVIDIAMQDWQTGDAILVLTSNQLNARSKLRKIIENNKHYTLKKLFIPPFELLSSELFFSSSGAEFLGPSSFLKKSSLCSPSMSSPNALFILFLISFLIFFLPV